MNDEHRNREDFRAELFLRVTCLVLDGMDPDAALELAVEQMKQDILMHWAQKTADMLDETGAKMH
jgi:hypothetical protein